MVEAWYDAQGLGAALDPVLVECIDYILDRDIEWTSGTIKVASLLEIRSRQSKGSKSNAKTYLHRAGIHYGGKGDDTIWIYSNAKVLDGIGEKLSFKWGTALLTAPGAEFFEAKEYSHVRISVSYFFDRILPFGDHSPVRVVA